MLELTTRTLVAVHEGSGIEIQEADQSCEERAAVSNTAAALHGEGSRGSVESQVRTRQ